MSFIIIIIFEKKMHFLGDMFHFTFEKIVTVMSYMDATCDLYSSIHMFFVFHGVWLSFYWDGD